MYTADNWVVMKAPDNGHYRLLTGTSGGYAQGDGWRLNSGITKFEDDDSHWLVRGSSGSVYRVHKSSNRVRMNCASVYEQLIKKGWSEVESKDWLNFNWVIGK